MRRDIASVERAAAPRCREQAVEQSDVAVGRDRQMQVGDVRRHGAARIDQHDLHLRPRLPGRREALVEHRMAPGEVGADQHDEIGELEILVAARHRVGAEGAPVAGDRRGHAEARIGVDVGRADEALHQLVGDVVVLGQQLAGDVEGDRVRPVLGDRLGEGRGDEIERLVPARSRAVHFGEQQPVVEVDRLGQSADPWSRAGRNWPDGRGRRGR